MPITKDLNFERVLNEQANAAKEAKTFESWIPPAGRWSVLYQNIRGGAVETRKKGSILMFYCQFKMLTNTDPAINGRVFEYGVSQSSWGAVKNLVKGLSGLTAEQANALSINQIIAELERNVGAVYEVVTSLNPSKDESTGESRTFLRMSFERKLQEAPGHEATPPAAVAP